MAKQTRDDRLRRLRDSRCPIHGTVMTQIRWDDQHKFVAQCARRDCEITGFTEECQGSIQLASEWLFLLEE